jgi:ribosomal protein S8
MPKDLIPDFIIRFRNRNSNLLTLYNSKKLKRILTLLKKENLLNFTIVKEDFKYLILNIHNSKINTIKQMSKQSRHIYKSHNALLTDPKLKNGFYIITNSEYG